MALLLCVAWGSLNAWRSTSLPVTETVPERQKVVYLTFDDGPSHNTEVLLDLLAAEDIKATFFVMNNTDDYAKELLLRAYSEGHTIGAHTACHNYGTIYRSVDSYFADLAQNEAYIRDITGELPRIMRFPGGSGNRDAPLWLRKELTWQVTERGYTYYDWNAVSGDDTAVVYAPQVLAANVIKNAGNADEIIVLFHDMALAKTTPAAAKLVIDYYRERGYVFLPLSPEVEPIQFLKHTSV